MSQESYTTDSRKNKHLTYRERYNIEILLKENLTTFEISKRLGRHKRTLEMEIGKGIRFIRKEVWEGFRQKSKTITLDNGRELLDFKGLELSVNNPEDI